MRNCDENTQEIESPTLTLSHFWPHRKSIRTDVTFSSHFSKAIRADVTFKKPGNGISEQAYRTLKHKPLAQDIESGAFLRVEDFEE